MFIVFDLCALCFLTLRHLRLTLRESNNLFHDRHLVFEQLWIFVENPSSSWLYAYSDTWKMIAWHTSLLPTEAWLRDTLSVCDTTKFFSMFVFTSKGSHGNQTVRTPFPNLSMHPVLMMQLLFDFSYASFSLEEFIFDRDPHSLMSLKVSECLQRSQFQSKGDFVLWVSLIRLSFNLTGTDGKYRDCSILFQIMIQFQWKFWEKQSKEEGKHGEWNWNHSKSLPLSWWCLG